MKHLSLLAIALIISALSFSQALVIKNGDAANLKSMHQMQDFEIHYTGNDFIIGTSNGPIDGMTTLVKEKPWQKEDIVYYIVYLPELDPDGYFAHITEHCTILAQQDDFMVIETTSAMAKHIVPAVHGGVVRINNSPIPLPKAGQIGKMTLTDPDPLIVDMIGQVDTANLRATVQHLQDYGTRNAYTPEAVQAANWLFDEYVNLGFDVEFHDFAMPGGPASDNVIATLTGTKYPDQYVVLGGHYDSYTWSGLEPGADDNASGTSGVLEAARIMSQYSFDRSIIFCAWGGEEYGLYGSAAWASEAAADGMNIIAYFNMDMAGYLAPGNDILTDIIAPSSAQELVDFYIDVCALYLPDFITSQGALSGGDSDHTSFNNAGYMGIFPFEDSQNYSPHIHTPNDVIGPSVNSFDMHKVFTQAIIANVTTMANQIPSPQNLTALAGDGEVSLTWESLDSVDHYNIYRDNDTIPIAQVTDTAFTDAGLTNGQAYLYFITAVFMETGIESPPSNEVEAVPMPPIMLPFLDDYETGGPYWTFDGTWGLKEGIFYSPSNSMTESPDGNYENDIEITAKLRSIDFSSYTDVQMSFWTKYQIEDDYDYMYLEVSENGNTWETLDVFTGTQNSWLQKSYSLNDYLGEPQVSVRFRFYSDVYVTENGMFIDDFMIEAQGVGMSEILPAAGKVSLYPNPAEDELHLSLQDITDGPLMVSISDITGKVILEGQLPVEVNDHRFELSSLTEGIYLLRVSHPGGVITKKLIKK